MTPVDQGFFTNRKFPFKKGGPIGVLWAEYTFLLVQIPGNLPNSSALPTDRDADNASTAV